MRGVQDLRASAARNNAEWCDAVCRTHGLEPAFAADAWTSRRRTPPHHPDAVTLRPDVSVDDLLSRIDASPGCSIKDSFASLDLQPFGFRVLFEGRWIARSGLPSPAGDAELRWSVVRTPETFGAWEAAARGDDPTVVLRPELLGSESVVLVAGTVDDRVVAGAALNRSAAVVGISNFFTTTQRAARVWRSCIGFVDSLFEGATIVGYVPSPTSVDGFDAHGPLRVWILDG